MVEVVWVVEMVRAVGVTRGGEVIRVARFLWVVWVGTKVCKWSSDAHPPDSNQDMTSRGW